MHLGQRGRPRKADRLPADLVAIATIDRVGQKTLTGVDDEEGKEVELDLGRGLLQSWPAADCGRHFTRWRRLRIGPAGARLDGLQHFVLLVSSTIHEGATEVLPASAIKFAHAVAIFGQHGVDALLPGVTTSANERLEARCRQVLHR